MTEFERPHYFTGKLLTADDLALEQRYHIEKRRLLNRVLHGNGVVSGLEVAPGEQEGTVTVAPGVALDPRGRELVVSQPQLLALPAVAEPVQVAVVYVEVETERSTVRETYEIVASTTVPDDAVVLCVVESGRITTSNPDKNPGSDPSR